jgi:hypothetical protein
VLPCGASLALLTERLASYLRHATYLALFERLVSVVHVALHAVVRARADVSSLQLRAPSGGLKLNARTHLQRRCLAVLHDAVAQPLAHLAYLARLTALLTLRHRCRLQKGTLAVDCWRMRIGVVTRVCDERHRCPVSLLVTHAKDYAHVGKVACLAVLRALHCHGLLEWRARLVVSTLALDQVDSWHTQPHVVHFSPTRAHRSFGLRHVAFRAVGQTLRQLQVLGRRA